jgi:hypothetical protein
METWSIEFVRKYVEIDEGLVACSDTETGLCLQSAYVMLRGVFVYIDQKSYVHLSVSFRWFYNSLKRGILFCTWARGAPSTGGSS